MTWGSVRTEAEATTDTSLAAWYNFLQGQTSLSRVERSLNKLRL